MILFSRALDAWATDDFAQVFKQDFNALSLTELPLIGCCTHSGLIDEDSIEVIILSKFATVDAIHLKETFA